MTLQNRFLLPVCGVTIAASVGAFLLANTLLTRLVQQNTQEEIAAKITEIEAYQKQIEQRCLSHAALFGRMPVVQQAYKLALSGNIDDEQDPKAEEARELLRKEFVPIAQNYLRVTGDKRYGLHFHLPNGRSLLRVWRGKQHASDDISSFRKTVLDINKGKHDPITGVEVGRGGFAIRGLAPVVGPDGEHLGSVEMLSAYTPLVLAAKTSETQDLGVYMNVNLLNVATKLTDEKKYPRVGDKYVLVACTNKDTVSRLVPDELLDAGASGTHTRSVGNYAITTFPVRDYAGKQIGVIAYALDNSASLAQLATARWSIGLGALALLVVLTITTTIVGHRVGRKLDHITSGLYDGAGQVQGAAEQVAGAAQNLAEHASQQASSLEQTSSALQELDSNAGANSQNAEQALTLSTETLEAAGSGNEIMNQLNEAMGGMDAASKQISRIIKVIEEIAFQTNLLALNAAVEAARAGEHGKGFAVVADEVRNLAQRSAEAAKETTALIEETVKRSQESTRVAGEAGSTFSEIMEKIAKVAELMKNISEASRTQAQGVNQISAAIAHMDQITQQNAAAAEQSASASEQLSGMAIALKDQLVADLVALARGSRRKHERRVVTAPTRVETPTHGTVEAQTHDVSAGGIGLVSNERLEVGTTATVVVPDEHGGRKVTGTVAHCTRKGDKYAVGIKFAKKAPKPPRSPKAGKDAGKAAAAGKAKTPKKAAAAAEATTGAASSKNDKPAPLAPSDPTGDSPGYDWSEAEEAALNEATQDLADF